jgi:hypothetical protein
MRAYIAVSAAEAVISKMCGRDQWETAVTTGVFPWLLSSWDSAPLGSSFEIGPLPYSREMGEISHDVIEEAGVKNQLSEYPTICMKTNAL